MTMQNVRLSQEDNKMDRGKETKEAPGFMLCSGADRGSRKQEAESTQTDRQVKLFIQCVRSSLDAIVYRWTEGSTRNTSRLAMTAHIVQHHPPHRASWDVAYQLPLVINL